MVNIGHGGNTNTRHAWQMGLLLANNQLSSKDEAYDGASSTRICLFTRTLKRLGLYELGNTWMEERRRRYELMQLLRTLSINIYKESEDNRMDILVDANKLVQVEKLLRDRDIPFEVTTQSQVSNPNRNKSPSKFSPRTRSPMKRDRTIIDWKDFYPLSNVYSFLEAMELKFPSTCTVISYGKTVEGRDMKLLKISNSNATNTGVWIDGGIHAREWISTSVVTYIADHFARNFENLPDYITNKDWYFAPIVNPDGYLYTHIQDRMWRKNRARLGNTIVGVDLNRNFGHNWGRNGNGSDFSSGDPCHGNFRGPEPFSEPETAAIKDLILYSSMPFKIFLTFHAYSEVISFPWCFTAEPVPDYVTLLEGGTVMAKAIYETNGKMYKVGNFKDLMYNASGTSIDWSYGTARIPFSYLVELRGRQHKFLLPKEEILDTCKENLNGILALANFVDRQKCLNCKLISKKPK